jgi:hypothetical protein
MATRKRALARVRERLSKDELDDLAWAYDQLEEPSFAARLTNVIGTPIEAGLRLLPLEWHRRVRIAAETSVRSALGVALATLPGTEAESGLLTNKLIVTVSGAAGGFFGPLALLAELPLTTTVMLRSIAQIARAQGEDPATPAGRRACVEVFALGGRSRRDDAADAGYYGLRLALAMHFTRGLERMTGEAAMPLGVQLVRAVASRFGVVVSDKVALQMVPVVGAVSGALVNAAFMQHFESVARGHFIVRRLERRYGAEAVRAAYLRIAREKTLREREFSPLEGW